MGSHRSLQGREVVVGAKEKKAQPNLVTISPEEAADMLEKSNSHNRHLRESVVYNYARQMQEGRWKYNGDTICISSDGRLIDGQHRLWACVVSDVPLETVIVRDLDMDTQDTKDSGLARTHADVLSLRGEKHAATRSSLAKNLLSVSHSSVFSKAELTEFHDAHRDPIDFTVEHFHSSVVKGVTQTSVGAAICRAWYYFDNKLLLARFCEVLRTGLAEDKREHAAVKLRNFLMDGVGQGVRRNRRELFLKTQAAIRAFMKGQALSNLQLPRSELFPLPEVDPVTGIKNGATENTVRHFRAKYRSATLPKTRGELVAQVKDKVAKAKARGK